MKNELFIELSQDDSIEVNGGSVIVVCAWIILAYIASPIIGYVGYDLYNTAKAGYNAGQAAR